MAKIIGFFLMIGLLVSACQPGSTAKIEVATATVPPNMPYLVVLGIAQDAGYPQAACLKDCCRDLWVHPAGRKMVSCLGLIDPGSKKAWLFDATPDFKDQLYLLQEQAPLAGIFLTHAHIGHYTGLMQLGREVMGANGVPVFAMPRMATYLAKNGPWSQLLSLNNIIIQPLYADTLVQLTKQISVKPFLVPHRDEFSETVGFQINGPEKSALFVPDIDKWEKWDRDINQLIQETDYALLDGSFYQNGEIPGRDMAQIPHPFVSESMERFNSLADQDKAKIHFIHFNHTNPLLWNEETIKHLEGAHYKIAKEGMFLGL